MPQDFVSSACWIHEIHLQLHFHLLQLFALYNEEIEPGMNKQLLKNLISLHI